jgi:AcrR family transcriptional regulator
LARLKKKSQKVEGGYKKSEESRRQVLDAAVAVFAKHGLSGTVQDIADAAGMSKGAVHYHFESKDDLYERVLEHCCDVMEKRVRSVFDAPGAPMERIRRALHEMWAVRRDGTAEMRVLGELHLLARQSSAIRRAFADAIRRARKQIVETGFSQLVAMGLRPRVSLDIAPRLLLASLDGLALQHEIDPLDAQEEAELLRAIEQSAMALFDL